MVVLSRDFLKQQLALWALPYAEANLLLADFDCWLVKFQCFAVASGAERFHSFIPGCYDYGGLGFKTVGTTLNRGTIADVGFASKYAKKIVLEYADDRNNAM